MPITELLRSLGALIFTLGLLLCIAWLARKYGLMQGANIGDKSTRRLKLIEQLWLDAGKTRIAIVSIDDREEVLIIGANGATQVSRHLKTQTPKEAIDAPAI